MTDLVEQLRQQKQIVPLLAIGQFGVTTNPVCEQAADELERLRAENARLREALDRLEASQTVKLSRTALTGGQHEPK